ncbi:MAG: hypothetical protein CVU34_11210 [Betaproteobacteria bacterium HGW-Betaproteobacteria-7]|nr:MAG: hypothetical protein CVU34_11210 [Betaproteobacteria bacterium HGW-Betaproteobacteria-7]
MGRVATLLGHRPFRILQAMLQRLTAMLLLGLATLPALAFDDAPALPERPLPGELRPRPLPHHFSAIAGPAWAAEAPATPAPTTEIIAAARAGDSAAVRRLLAAGSPPNTADADGERPLPVAVAGAHVESVRLLLQAGARPDARGAAGRLPLGLAAAGGQLSIVRQLLAAGANIDGRSANGATALHEAVRFDHPDVLAELLRAGPRPELSDREGLHPLALAAALGRVRCLEVLLDGGVAIDLPDRAGLTALYWARRYDRQLAEARLLARGAGREAWPLVLD